MHQSDPLHTFQNGSPLASAILKKIGKNITVKGGLFSSISGGHQIGNMINRLVQNGGGYTKLHGPKIEWGSPSFEFD